MMNLSCDKIKWLQNLLASFLAVLSANGIPSYFIISDSSYVMQVY